MVTASTAWASCSVSLRPAERQVDAAVAQKRVLAALQLGHAVVSRAATRRPTRPRHRAEAENSLRDRDVSALRTGRRPADPATRRRSDAQVALVPVLMQRQPSAWRIAVDQAGIRHEARVAGLIRGAALPARGSTPAWLAKDGPFPGRSGRSGSRRGRSAIHLAAIGHRDRHHRAPSRRHVPERRLRVDVASALRMPSTNGRAKPRSSMAPGAIASSLAPRQEAGGTETGQASAVAVCIAAILGCSTGR